MWISGSDTGLADEGTVVHGGRHPVSAGPGTPARTAASPEGTTRLTVIGDCYASARQLTDGLAAVRSGDWRALTRWPGSYWTVCHDGRETTILTDVAGTRPVYYAPHAGGTAWASQASRLAALTGASPALEEITARMACPTVTEVCGTATAWTGVRRLPGGCALRIGGGPPRVARYEPDDEILPFGEAAVRLRDALTTATGARARASSRLSSDFSGGLDSTSVALLAARAGYPMLAITHDDPADASDDVAWARRMASGQPLINHRVVPGASLFFDRMDQAPPTDQPFSDAARWARRADYQQAVLRYGSDLHLTGTGGDTLLAASPSCLADLVTPRALGQLARHAVARARLRHLPARTVLASAITLSRCSYPDALRQLAADIRRPPARWERAAATRRPRWFPSGGITAWLTPTAREPIAARADAAAGSPGPAGIPVSRHRAWSEVREFGTYQAELAAQARAGGVNPHAPLLDNEVVRAAMAIPVASRQSVQVQKPLLGAALNGLVPAELLERATKGAYDGNAYAGLRANAASIRGLLDGSRLAAAGLVDLVPVRDELDRLTAGAPGRLASLETLITAELWLRQARPEAVWHPVETAHA